MRLKNRLRGAHNRRTAVLVIVHFLLRPLRSFIIRDAAMVFFRFFLKIALIFPIMAIATPS